MSQLELYQCRKSLPRLSQVTSLWCVFFVNYSSTLVPLSSDSMPRRLRSDKVLRFHLQLNLSWSLRKQTMPGRSSKIQVLVDFVVYPRNKDCQNPKWLSGVVNCCGWITVVLIMMVVWCRCWMIRVTCCNMYFPAVEAEDSYRSLLLLSQVFPGIF